jgi:hypothetical protein
VARGRPNDRPALFGSAEGMLIKGYSIGKSPFGPTHPSLGPLFSGRRCPIFRARGKLPANPSDRCSAFTISPRGGLQVVSYPA